MQNMTKRLRREITANPKKAAILGGMLLVALYFWAPLVGGWLGLGKSGATPVAKGPDPNAAMLSGFGAMLSGAPGPQPTTAAASVPKHAWQQVAEWIRNDPRSQPASPAENQRDPFQQTELKSAAVAVAKAAAARKRYTPETLGLTLTGTLIGSQRRLAVINGQVYPEKAEFRVKADGNEVAFRVAEVQRQAVILRQGEETFNLKLKSVLAEGSANRGSAGGL
jgi:hypothetical protein